MSSTLSPSFQVCLTIVLNRSIDAYTPLGAGPWLEHTCLLVTSSHGLLLTLQPQYYYHQQSLIRLLKTSSRSGCWDSSYSLHRSVSYPLVAACLLPLHHPRCDYFATVGNEPAWLCGYAAALLTYSLKRLNLAHSELEQASSLGFLRLSFFF